MKRILAMVLAVMLLVGCSAEVDEADKMNEIIAPASSENTASNQSGLDFEIVEEVIEFPLKDGTVYYKNEIKYPRFKGDSEIEKTLNSKYDERLKEYKNNSTDYDELYSRLVSQGVDVDSNIPYYDNVSIDVTYNKNGVISLKEVNVSWSGGAHPYHTVDGYTYKISDGTELNYYDIIKGEKDVVDSVLKQYFTETQGACKDTYFNRLKNETPYSLCEDGLCFYYWVGDAVDRVEIIIPYTQNHYIISAERLYVTEESMAETTVETTAKQSISDKSESGGLSADNSQSNNNTSKPSYKNVISQAIKEAEAFSPYEEAQGVLYDVDGNGVDELIMVFNSLNGTNPYDGQTIPAALYSVYTISGNKVINLIDKEQLFTLAGGPAGEVNILKNGSETLLSFSYSEVNPSGRNELYCSGDWHIYKISGNKIEKIKTVNYSYLKVSEDGGENYSIKYNESSATINNSKKPYKEFEQWLDSYNSMLLFRSYGQDDSTSLKTLLNNLD